MTTKVLDMKQSGGGKFDVQLKFFILVSLLMHLYRQLATSFQVLEYGPVSGTKEAFTPIPYGGKLHTNSVSHLLKGS